VQHVLYDHVANHIWVCCADLRLRLLFRRFGPF
jgi:hypothetical protein